MSLVLLNVFLAVGVVVMLVLARIALRRWGTKSTEDHWRILAPLLYGPRTRTFGKPEASWTDDYTDAELAYMAKVAKSDVRIVAVLRILNVATTVVALFPLGFTLYSVFTNHQSQALTSNFVSLGAVVVGKGGLFVLTVVLIPLLKAVPAGVGTGIGGIVAHKLWERAVEPGKPQGSKSSDIL